MANYSPPKNKIHWTEEMLQILIQEFPVTLNNDMAAKLNVSPRTMHRKADELGLKKAPNFKELTAQRCRELQSKAMKIVAKKNNGCFKKGQHACPEHEYKPGIRNTILTPEQEARRKEKARKSRNKTIYLEMLRLKYDRPQQTKLKLKNIITYAVNIWTN